MPYDIGDVVRITASFTNVAGVAADPTTTALLVMLPDGSEASYATEALVHDSIGTFHLDLGIAQSGTYSYRWTGSGTVAAVMEDSFEVTATILVPPGPI
jgi:hypothetical protein